MQPEPRGAGTRATPKRGPIAEEIRQLARPGRSVDAVKAFETAVSLLERERDAPAVAAAEEAKALAPRSGAIREVLGIALYRTGRYRDSLRELQAYRRITGRADQNHLMADCYRALGSPEKAIPLVREAIRSRLSDAVRAEAAVVGASALADLGRFTEGLSLLAAFPATGDVGRDWQLRLWYVTADLLERSGRRDEAVSAFRRIMRHDADAFDVAERLAAMGG